jgi:ferric-chelate reductase (NADPH)
MSTVPQFLTDTFEKLFLRPAVVTAATHLSGHFRLVELAGERLKTLSWVPGEKVQFHLGKMNSRTYTPIAWNPHEGTAQFIMFLHGHGPGSEWAESLKQGSQCRFMGPRSSLNFSEIDGDSIFFGDETSIAAAMALHSSNGDRDNRFVFEVSSLVESGEVLQRIGLPNAKLVKKTPDLSHLAEVEESLVEASSDVVSPRWIFTGKGQSIQSLRRMLRARRMTLSQVKTKAYWAEGKTGLD